MDDIAALTNDILAISDDASNSALEVTNTTIRNTNILVYSGLVLVLLLSTVITYMQISRPVKRISRALTELAGGDLAVEVDGTRRDELGDMARAFVGLRNSLRMAKDLEAAQRVEKEEAARRNAEELEARRRAALELEAAQRAEKEEAARRTEEELKARKAEAVAHLVGSFQDMMRGVVDELSTSASGLQTNAQEMSAIARQAQEQSSAVAVASQGAWANVNAVASATEEIRNRVRKSPRVWTMRPPWRRAPSRKRTTPSPISTSLAQPPT